MGQIPGLTGTGDRPGIDPYKKITFELNSNYSRNFYFLHCLKEYLGKKMMFETQNMGLCMHRYRIVTSHAKVCVTVGL